MKQQGPHGIGIEKHVSEVEEAHDSGTNTTEYRCQSLKSKIRTHYKRQLPTPTRERPMSTIPKGQRRNKAYESKLFKERNFLHPTAMTFNFLSMRSTVTCDSQCHSLLRHSSFQITCLILPDHVHFQSP